MEEQGYLEEVIEIGKPQGFVDIDEWVPNPEDMIFTNSKGVIELNEINKIFGLPDHSPIGIFMMTPKKCYNSNTQVKPNGMTVIGFRDHCTHYLNYFEKFYDTDRQLVSLYAQIKYLIEYQEHYTEDNFITAEIVDKDITYTFPMNVKIYSERISSIKFFVDGEWRDSVPEDMVGGVQLAASVTFDSGYTTELATYIREGTNGYGYAYIGYDIENCESTGELTEYEGYRFKQAKRIRIDSSAGV